MSCDLNYRAKLWSESKARSVMSELMEYVDVLVANEEDAGKLNIDGYKNVAEKLMNKFDLEIVGSHLHESRSASDNGWLVALYDGKKFVKSIKYNIHIVDRVSTGMLSLRVLFIL